MQKSTKDRFQQIRNIFGLHRCDGRGTLGFMQSKIVIPPKVKYEGEVPGQEELLEAHKQIQTRHDRALGQVDEMFRTQNALGKGIRSDLAGLKKHSESLDELERAAEQEQGLLASLVSRFVQRRTVLNRRSETQALLQKHASVSARLRKASAFTDTLRVESLELQEEVQGLHQEIRKAKTNASRSAQRILDLEAALQHAESDTGDADARLEAMDTLRFEIRQETQNLDLFEAMEEMCKQHLRPARKLRDTVTKLQEEMSLFVVHATGTVDSAGRRIQALGAAADAPLVIQELQESMDDLTEAMKVTEEYVAQTQELLGKVLPELTAQVKAESETRNFILESQLDDMNRERATSRAKRTLQAEAEKEIEQFLRGDT